MPSSIPAPWALLAFRELAPPGAALRFSDPVEVLVARRRDEVIPLLAAAERAAARGLHAVGLVAYEAAPAFDPAFVTRAPGPLPLAWFGLFPPPALVTLPPPNGQTAGPGPGPWSGELSPAEHAAGVGAVHSAIAAGDVYQVNLTERLTAPFAGNPIELFLRMQSRQQGGWAAYLDLGPCCIASASPELFFHTAGDTIVSRPMKGTAPRGRWADEDRRQAAYLAESPKERAENVMIVDLIRNDLGRVALPGSVRVPRMLEVERYPTVFQLTSTVAATLRPGVSLADIFTALFPCGSVTGAPKISACRLITQLERSPRGAYCGAVGYLAPNGTASFNVAIRTATVDRERRIVEYGAGGGITWDSVASAEHRELVAKAAIATEPAPVFNLVETLRLDGGNYPRLSRHLDRLLASAGYFGFAADRLGVEQSLARAAADCGPGPHRVRLLLATDGSIRTEVSPLPPPAPAPLPVGLAAEPADRGDPFLYHKTDNRPLYLRERRARPELFDVLFHNREGDLTEFTIGNLVVELPAGRFTPPIEAGVLPGTFRAELLERGDIIERTLRPEDLPGARLYLINSLREWVPVALVPG